MKICHVCLCRIMSKSVVSTMYYSEYSIFISWQRIRIFIPVAEPYYVIIITDYYYSAHITILQVCWGQGTTPGHSGLAVVKTNI